MKISDSCLTTLNFFPMVMFHFICIIFLNILKKSSNQALFNIFKVIFKQNLIKRESVDKKLG